MDALKTGKNKLFISASKNQAHVFKRNIINFVRDNTGVELTGDPIILSNGAELHFLGTNKNTAQSYSGDLYIDECFWIPGFTDIEHIASGMTVLDDRSITYFSTASSEEHPAYKVWSGESFNEGRPKNQHVHLDLSHAALIDGKLCADGQWRQIVTIEDAIDRGYNLVTMEKLRLKFPPAKFDNLLMCKFASAADSVFPLNMMLACAVDPWEKWRDFNQTKTRPFGNRPVWIGYDPSRTKDDACLVVISPPSVTGGKYRLLEKTTMQGIDFEDQAKVIKDAWEKYNVEYIGIDTSGIGKAVHDLVVKFFPATEAITYNVEVKNMLVLQALQVISRRRFEYSSNDQDLPYAFMTISRSMTPRSKQITYQAARTEKSGHADEAWAVMHALKNAELGFSDEEDNNQQSFMETF